ETTAVRFDYYQTVSRLWIDNFFRPIYQWCDKHHLEFTGHLWEHEWPVPAKQPVVMHTYRWMQAPGTDLLGFQFFPTKFEDQTLAYLNQKETSSVANQLGCRRIMCESCGGGGYGMALREFKPLEDFLLAGGVNVVTPHLSYQTLAGARKYDWPQTISDHSSWWDAYRLQADHVGRVGYALGQGQERNRLLVLHPCTTGWIRYQHKDFALGEQPETDRLQVIGESQQQLLADLHGGQIDFDLGDELTMAELGAVEGNRLRIGQAIYDAVVVPPAMENWTSATLARMEQYLKAGGTVYACARPPAFVDGRTSNKPAELARRYPNQWKQHPTGEQMVAAVRADVPPRISRPDGSPLPLGLCWRRHERPDGTIIYFFCHPWNEPCRTAVRLEGRSLVALDTVKGTAMPVPCRPVEGGQIVTLDLPALGHALLVASPRGGASAPEQPRRELRDLQLASLAVERQAPNVLPLLFCDLQTGDTKAEGVNTTIADELNWKTYGLRGNIWSGSAQFRRTLIDKQFPPDSGFRVTYRFTIDPDALAAVKPSLELAVERPWLYSITVNGKAMDTRDAVRWFDPNIRKMSIEDVIQAGDNRVTLDARPMRSLCEIMPVYVLGDFALEPGETGFTIDKPRKLKMGSWNEQGLPFYADKVAYRYRFSLEQPQENFTIGLPAWSGSVGTIRIDGAKVGVIAWPPDRLEFDRSLSAGEHSLEIIVAGNMKNLMGPHFSDGLPGIWTWRWSGQNTQPAEAYSFAPCGLQKAPVLRGRFESVQ
ncbi:MAG TPA: hypothetical protein VE890_15495, partial [Thermoguttaceae bacterium]|nr:hypothetical protein [Thermoguttaceae bacterium]